MNANQRAASLLSAAIDLRDGLAFWLDRLKRRGLRPNSLAAYRADMLQHVECVEARRASTLVALQSERTVSAWLDWLSARGVSPRSQARKLTVVRAFYRFAKAEGWLSHDPTHGEAVKFRAKRIIAPDMAALYAMVESIPRASREDLRDRALLRVALDAAIRISEAAALNIPGIGAQSTVDLERGMLYAIGKGGDTEAVCINERTVAMLRDWLHVRPYAARDGETALFVSRRGTRISRQTLHVICKTRGAAAGLPEGFTWHTMRHRRIGDIYETLGTEAAQTHARHASRSTTEDTYGHHGETRMRSLVRTHADLDALQGRAPR